MYLTFIICISNIHDSRVIYTIEELGCILSFQFHTLLSSRYMYSDYKLCTVMSLRYIRMDQRGVSLFLKHLSCHLVMKMNSWTVYFIQNPEGHRPKWKHKHINTWWLIHTTHTQGNKLLGNENAHYLRTKMTKTINVVRFFK